MFFHCLLYLKQKLQLDQYLLYAHGPDLCKGEDLRHAMANCFEALMGALYLEGGLDEVQRVFAPILFDDEVDLQAVWSEKRKHPLQV